MKKGLLLAIPLIMGCACYGEDVTISFQGATAFVTQNTKDSVSVTVDGARVSIESLYQGRKLTLRLTGESDDGRLTLKTAGKAIVTLDGLKLTSQEGAPIELKNKKKVEVTTEKGTENTLTITACTDTANHKAAVIWAKDKLLLSGKGLLNVVATGDGCRGIKTKKDITIQDVTLNVTTSGNNLGVKPNQFPGGFPGEFPGDSIKPGGFSGGFPGGEMPAPGKFPGFPGDSIKSGGFPSLPGDSTMQGGFPGKQKYVASTKGIASKGKITINGGTVTVRTSTPGAEGIEGKQGIVFGGGTVDVFSLDDAINANATIEFNGAHVTARSKGNDAVDANPEGGFFPPIGGNGMKIEPAIIIRDGTVYAWSQVGPPEEGLDSDMAPLAIEGGTVFTVGGFIGDMPSVPTNETAKQPTALLVGLDIAKDEPLTISDASGKIIDTVTVPFNFRGSASIVTTPVFKLGNAYTVKTKGYEKTFTLTDPFTVVR